MAEGARDPPQGRADLRRILRNTASILVGDAGGQVLVGASIAIAAMSLGPAGFGRLNAAQAFVDPFNALAGFGLVQVSIRECARRGECDGTIRGTVGALQLVFACVAVVVSLSAAMLLHRSELIPQILVVNLATMMIPLTTIGSMPFRFDQAMHRLLVVPFIASLSQIGLAIFAARHWDVPIAFQAAIVSTVVANALLTFFLMRRWYPTRLAFDPVLARLLLAVAWPAAINEFVILAYSRGSYFFLNQAGAVAQGEYGAADRLVKPVLHIAGALFTSSLPTVAILAAQGRFRELRTAYRRSFGRVLLGLTPILLGACFVAPWLLRRYAPIYAAATTPFRILAVGALFMFLNYLSSAFLIALGQFRLLLGVVLVDFVVYVVLASVLVPRWGASGAAMATTTMEAVNATMQALAVALCVKRAIDESPRNVAS